jgi:hypothetical protein
VAAVIAGPGIPLLVFGTVLPWHSDPGPEEGVKAPSWSEHYRVIREQDEEWSALRDSNPELALCVAGDLNVNLGGKHFYGTREGRGLSGFPCVGGRLNITPPWP